MRLSENNSSGLFTWDRFEIVDLNLRFWATKHKFPHKIAALVLLIVASNATVAGTPSPVLELRLNGDATDSSVNGFNGTLSGGPTYAADRRNSTLKALNLNGSDQFVAIPDSDTLDFSGGTMSLSVWFKLTNLNNNVYMRIISKKTNFGDANGYELAYNPVANQMELDSGSGALGQLLVSNIDLDGNWHHVAGIIDGANFALYLDGTQIGSATGRSVIAANANPLRIGSQTDSSDDFIGIVDDVRLYDVALTSTDVTALFNQAPAAVSVWDGGGGNANWSTAANWLGDVIPSPGDDLIFDTPSNGTANNDLLPGLPYDRVFIANAFTLTGNSISISEELHVFASGTATIGLDIGLPVSGLTFLLDSSLTVNGRFTGSSALTPTASNTPTLTLAGQSTFSGGLTLTNANLVLGIDSTPTTGVPTSGPVGTGILSLNNVTLSSTATRNIANNVSIAGSITLAGTSKVVVNGTANMGGASRTLTVTDPAGELEFGNAPSTLTITNGALIAGSGTPDLTKAGNGKLTISGPSSIGRYLITSGKLLVTGARGKINGNAVPEIRIDAAAILELDYTTAPTAVSGSINERLDDTDTIQLNGDGATIKIAGNGSSAITELVANIQLNAGNSVIDISAAGSNHITLNAQTSFTPAGTGGIVEFKRNSTFAHLVFANLAAGQTVTANQCIPYCLITDTFTPVSKGDSVYVSTGAPATGVTTTASLASPVSVGIVYVSQGTGDWSTATNWLPNGTPGVNDVVEIASNHVVYLNGNRSVRQVRFTGGGQIVPNNQSGSGSATDILTLGSGATVAGSIIGTATATNPAIRSAMTLSSTTLPTVIHHIGTGTMSLLGNIGGGAAFFRKDGSGRLLFGGVNTFTGASRFNSGILAVANNSALGNGNAIDFRNGTLDVDFVAGVSPIIGTTPFTAYTLNNPLTVSASLTINASVTDGTNPVDLILTGASTLSGNITVNGIANVTLQGNVGLNGADRTFTINSAAPSLTQHVLTKISGVVSGGNRLTKQGVGELELAGNNTHNGATSTVLTSGILTISHINALGAGGTATLQTDGGEIRAKNGGSTLSINKLIAINATTKFGGTNTGEMQAEDAQNYVDLIDTNNFNIVGGDRTLDIVTGRTLTVNTVQQNGGTRGLTKTGAGTLVLASGSSSIGNAFNVSGGTLRLTGTAGITGSSVNPSMVISGGATLECNNSSNVDRINDGYNIRMDGGNILFKANTVSLTETINNLIVNSGANSIKVQPVNATALNAVVTLNSLTRVGGTATLDFVRDPDTSTTPIGALFTGGFADTAPIAFATVTTAGVTAPASYSTSTGVIPQVLTTFVTTNSGPWDIGTTWVGGSVPPSAGTTNVIIKHSVTLNDFRQVSTLRFQDNGSLAGTGATGLIVGDVAANGSLQGDAGGTNAGNYVVSASLSLAGTECAVGGAGNLVLNGQLAGTAQLTKTGAGDVSLTNASNVQSGGTTVAGGRLLIGSNGALGGNGTRLTLSSGVCEITASFILTGHPILADGGTLRIGNGLTLTVRSVMVAGTNPFTKDGLGTVFFDTQSSGTTRTGTTFLSQGTMAFQALTAGTSVGSGVLTVSNATLEMRTTGAANEFVSTPLALADGSIVRCVGSANLTGSGFTGAVSLIDPATVQLVAPGATDVLRFTNTISGGGAATTLHINGMVNAVTQLGRVACMGNNTFTGPTIADSGILQLNNPSALGVTANVLTINSSANAFCNGTAVTYPNSIILNGGTLSANSSDTNIFSGQISAQAASTITTDSPVGGQFNVTITGEITGSAALTIKGGINTKGVIFANPNAPTMPYTGSITVQGPSYLELRNATALPGAATILMDSGTPLLRLRGDSAQVFTASVNATTANPNATIDVNQTTAAGTNNTLTLGALTLGGSALNVTGGNGYTLAFNGATTLAANASVNPTTAQLVLNGVIGETGGVRSLTKIGAGSLSLGATSTYTGTTNLNAGITSVIGSTGSGTTTVAVGATLTGNGTISGPFSVNGILAPGTGADSTATITAIGAVVFAPGSIFNVDITDATIGNFDQLVATSGTLTLGNATLNINLGGTIASAITLIDKQSANAIPDTFNGFGEGNVIVCGGRLLGISYIGGTGNDLTLTDVGATSNTISVLPTTLSTVEGGAPQAFVIRLNAVPTAAVTIPLSSSNTAEGTVPAQVVISPTGNANVVPAATILVTPVDDALVDGNVAFVITTGDPSSADASFNALAASDVADVAVTNYDNEIIISSTTVTAVEGGADATFTIRLPAAPNGMATILVSLSDTAQLSLQTAVPLTFNAGNFATPQTVTIRAINDAIVEGPKSYTATVSIVSATTTATEYLSSMSRVVTINVTDNDAGILVSSAPVITTEGGIGQIFTVALSTIPTSAVTVSLAGNAAQGTLSTTALNFANDATALIPQTVTVTSVNNSLDEGDISYAVNLNASGDVAYNTATALVNVTDIDNDSAAVVISPAVLNTIEGGAPVTFSISLAAQPTAGVIINMTNGNTGEGTLSAALIAFSTVNWNIPQIVTITPVNDSVADGPQSYQITFGVGSADSAYNNLLVSPVTVTNGDNPPPSAGSGIIINPASPTVGFPVKFLLDVTDPQGQPISLTWDYGDGSPTDSLGNHVYAASTTVTVTATFSDGLSIKAISANLSISSASSPEGDADGDGSANNVDSDDDGDGFPDELEAAMGTSSLDPLDKPNTGPAKDMFVTKASVKLSFKKAGSDSIQLTARLPITEGQAISGITAVLDVGGIVRKFALTKSAAKSGADSIKFGIKQTNGVTLGQVSLFSAKLNKGNFQTNLGALGLTNDDVAGVSVKIPVYLIFDNKYYISSIDLRYFGKKNFMGKTMP